MASSYIGFMNSVIVIIGLLFLSSCSLNERGLLAGLSGAGGKDASGGYGGHGTSSGGTGTAAGGGGAGGQSPPCHPAGLADDFEGAAVDTNLWNTQGEQSIMSVAGGQLRVIPGENVNDGQWVGLVTDLGYNLSGCAVWIEASSLVKGGAEGQTYFQLYTPDGESRIRVENGELQALVRDKSVTLGETSTPYVALQHRWWRIREDGGQLHLETSPDFIMWTTLLSPPTPSYIANIAVGLGVVSPTNATNLGETQFDNFDVVP